MSRIDFGARAEKHERLFRELANMGQSDFAELAAGEHGEDVLNVLVGALGDLVDLRDELMAAREGWRPIETAPRDGAWILVWLGGISNCADTVQWAYGDWWNGCSGHVPSAAAPTLWRPLPAPPAGEDRG